MADYKGARGSNAGDDFHELWAMQQALGLLIPNTDLVAVAVEGLSIEDETGSSTTTWDGVDCAFYYGTDSAKTATRIVVDQLKYSGADPASPWTVARLAQSKGKKKNNPVIQRLASAFAGLVALRGGSSNGIVVRLVSNQPVDQEVIDALHTPVAVITPQLRTVRDQLQEASGLTDILFSAFTSCLDLRVLTGSRFQLTENVLLMIPIPAHSLGCCETRTARQLRLTRSGPYSSAMAEEQANPTSSSALQDPITMPMACSE